MSYLIKAIIFDLDNCLAPAKQLNESVCQPVFAAIASANSGEVSQPNLLKAFEDCWRHSFDWVASQYGFSNDMLKAGLAAFSALEVTHPIQSYGDIDELVSFQIPLFLVTSGFRRLQESKIQQLGITDLFTAVFIDVIDEPNRMGKRKIFEKIMLEYQLAPNELLVVGDNADSEIAAGNQLGIPTVQTLRPDVPNTSTATYHVNGLKELRALYLELDTQ